MSVHQASAAWQRAQAQTLKATYTSAWRAGVRNYRSQYATPLATPLLASPVPAPAPTIPAATPMQRALSPALSSLARMGAALAVLVPTSAQIAAAGTVAAATALAAKEYLERAAYLLAGGVSVAWAGEQHGYAQAAARDGLLLEWQLDPSPAVHHCSDCPALAALPPMPVDRWPTLPGEGLTECSVGCKCSMRAVPARARPLTADEQMVVSRIAARQPVLVAA